MSATLTQLKIEYCTRCSLNCGSESGLGCESDLLRELAYGKERYMPDLVKKAQRDPDSAIHKEAAKQMAQRLEADVPLSEIDGVPDGDEMDECTDGMFQTDDREGPTAAQGAPKQERDDVTEEDVRNALAEFEKNGEISFQNGKVIVTPKGVNRLAAGALKRILENLRQSRAGANRIEKEDLGVEPSPHTRRYEAGDDYYSVDVERTSLNALARTGQLSFEPEDFEIREEIFQSKLCAAIIIDESGSMRDLRKLEAAMETALALSRLIMREPENVLKVFVFSDEVKQIEPWAIVNQVITGGDTDIKAALAAFRRASRNEFGDKQAYLITDAEPNNEAGRHLPFEKAVAGLIEEASRYRQEKIGLNIIMLSDVPELKSLASTLAKRNLGRVFFTTPTTLGEVLVEDYLKGRREGAYSPKS